jgi:hypothetical protein
MDVMTSTFSEVGRHGVTDGSFGGVALGEANVFLAGFEVWLWIDDMFALGVQNV